MAELINSLKTFAYSGSISYDRRYSSGQLRIIPLLNLGRTEDVAQDSGFSQWRDAMRMVARLPGGLPTQFRLKLWENLSEKYLKDKGIQWTRVLAKSSTPNSRDSEITDQIHKDLHRTGCTGFSGAKQAKLKTVLMAYGRWNPEVGYCQGFNMIGAMLLEMTEGDETLTLKVLIYVIEGVLPQGYFSGGLRGLAVDMAVFREILRIRKPRLHEQLCWLQGGEDQPPLIDVFTMHWFLTLFIHCLPTPSVLRIWDLVLLEGSEVLLRTALVLWAAIETRILGVTSADEFYSVMGVVTREMLELGLMDVNSLVKCVVSVGPFPFPGLVELRQKHRALVQQETPYKSFFLAKKELDNLKKHYAAIRHRQRATTIILKGLEVSKIRVPGQRSNSLIPFSKKQTVPSKPKLRRGSSGSKSSLINNNNKNSTNNLNNKTTTGTTHIKPSSNVRTINNGNAPSVKPKQGTIPKSTISKTGKSFRRRRTLSSSSLTSSSSSTELCDSSSDSSSSSEGVWSDSDNQWVKKSKKKITKHSEHKDKLLSCNFPVQSIKTNEVSEEQIEIQDKADPPSPASSDPGGLRPVVKSSSIIDTNDSQHFLDEMKKLGKSDSFYENLSKRICELQFQNLKTLSSCTTVIDPKSLTLPPFPKSPLPSPISPHPPASFCLEACTKLVRATPSPRHLSPRGSVSSTSATDSPLPKTPISPLLSDLSLEKQDRNCCRISLSRKTSKSSVSSVDLPDICIVDDDDELVKHNVIKVGRDELTEDCGSEINESVEDEKLQRVSPFHSVSSPPLLSPLDFKNCLVSPISLNADGMVQEAKSIEEDYSSVNVENDNEFQIDPSLSSAICQCECQTTDEINEVIRENIAILQRLKLSKTAYLDDDEDDCSYEDATSCEEEDTTLHPSCQGLSDKDSGVPSSSKNSITTIATNGRLSSISSSNASTSPTTRRRRNSSTTTTTAGSKTFKERSFSLNSSKGQFNPFPTVRKARLRVTKYGLYN